METATLAGGCFWCTEAIFKRLKGVLSVIPGYSGGNPPEGGLSPTYEQVSSGKTNHAESVQITFDPTIISFEKLLEVFFALHDPTTLNQQGADIGTQYRSAIFYHSEKQKQTAEKIKATIPKAVTEITRFTAFYAAEAYHKDYYEKNSKAGYCKIVIDPKITKLYKEFSEVVKH